MWFPSNQWPACTQVVSGKQILISHTYGQLLIMRSYRRAGEFKSISYASLGSDGRQELWWGFRVFLDGAVGCKYRLRL